MFGVRREAHSFQTSILLRQQSMSCWSILTLWHLSFQRWQRSSPSTVKVKRESCFSGSRGWTGLCSPYCCAPLNGKHSTKKQTKMFRSCARGPAASLRQSLFPSRPDETEQGVGQVLVTGCASENPWRPETRSGGHVTAGRRLRTGRHSFCTALPAQTGEDDRETDHSHHRRVVLRTLTWRSVVVRLSCPAGPVSSCCQGCVRRPCRH